MRVHTLERSQLVPADPDDVFEFFARARNLERLTPPWLRFQVLTPEPIAMREGTLIDYRLRLHRLPIRWHTRIERWVPPRTFVDRQLRGPYRLWHHRHEFTAAPGGTLMRDRVHYALPLGALGALALPLVRRDLRAIFDHRQAVIAAAFDGQRPPG
jgi:ligand-binding SRPBCC domain-containing protein